MAATSIQDIKDFRDVVRLLEEHPEWRAELRRLLLTDDLLALPEQVAALVEAQTRTEARVAELAEAQRRTETQVATLIGRVDELAAVQTRTEQQVAALVLAVHSLTDEVGKLKGKGLETHYRLHGSPFFGVLLRHPHVLSSEELSDVLEPAIDQGVLSPAEAVEIQRADVVVRGIRREDGTVIYLVVEVSWTVDTEDVERAARRAVRLAKAGLTVLPVVAGESVRSTAAELAHTLHVWQMTDAEAVPPTS